MGHAFICSMSVAVCDVYVIIKESLVLLGLLLLISYCKNQTSTFPTMIKSLSCVCEGFSSLMSILLLLSFRFV